MKDRVKTYCSNLLIVLVKIFNSQQGIKAKVTVLLVRSISKKNGVERNAIFEKTRYKKT